MKLASAVGWAQGVTMRHRCTSYALFGLMFGLVAITSLAWAQTPMDASVATDTPMFWVELLKGGGLPAALVAFGTLLGRGGVPLRLTSESPMPVEVRLAEEDRALLRQIAEGLRGRQ